MVPGHRYADSAGGRTDLLLVEETPPWRRMARRLRKEPITDVGR